MGSWPSLCTNVSSHSHQLSPGPQSREADPSTFRLRNHIPDNHRGRGSETALDGDEGVSLNAALAGQKLSATPLPPFLGRPTDASCLPSHLSRSFLHSSWVYSPPSLSIFIGWLRSRSQWHALFFFPASRMKQKSKADSQSRIELGLSARHSIPQPPHQYTLLISLAKW